MGGHHEFKFPKVPDYRQYKVEDVPELVEVQKKLRTLGLRDPWLRNEVWRYRDAEYNPNILGLLRYMFAQFKYGIVIGVVATIITKACKRHPEDEKH